MKKLVLKTTLITLASVLGAIVLTIGALCLFAPATCAQFFDGVGNYSASVFFYEKHYEKTGDVNVLDTLFSKAYGAEDFVRAEDYAKKIVEHDDFDLLCDDQVSDNTLSDKEYYYANYALLLAKNGKFDTAISVGEEFVAGNGYTKFNPLRALVDEYLLDAQKADALKTVITVIENGLSGAQETYANEDLNKLN